jgi:hypothetical protein
MEEVGSSAAVSKHAAWSAAVTTDTVRKFISGVNLKCYLSVYPFYWCFVRLFALYYVCLAKELKITPILDRLLEYKRNWIQHGNRMPRNRLPRIMKRQKEPWQTFEEASGYVRPERVNKWPNSMTDK